MTHEHCLNRLLLASILTCVTTVYATTHFRLATDRLLYNIFYRNAQTSPISFPDPAGAQLEWRYNNTGELMLYLAHPDSESRHVLSRDLYPDTKGLCHALHKRISTFGKEEAVHYLPLLEQLVQETNARR